MKNKVLVVVGIVLLAFAAYLVSQRMSPQEVPRAPAETAVQEVLPVPAEPATPAVEGEGAVQQQISISSVAVHPDEPPEAKGKKKERQMPLADLLERASAKWGLQFDDFYRYREGREEWSIWEQKTNEYISDYLASEFHQGIVETKTEHFRHQYKQLWEQGVALADVPTPAELEPDDGVYNRRMWDEELGVYRRLDPTIYVDLSQIKQSQFVTVYNPDTVRYVDGASPLSSEDRCRLIERGVHPEGVKVIYIDQNGQELPLGQRPRELDPAESFKYMSDERLRLAARRWESALNMSPDQEKAFLKMIKHPMDRMITENALFAFMSAWSERPSAWVPPAPSTGAAHGPPSAPLSPVNALPDSAASVEPGSRVPAASPPSEPPSFEKPPMELRPPDAPIPARDLEGLLDAIKQEETGEGLTDEERSILRLKELHDLYEAERRRRLRRDSD